MSNTETAPTVDAVLVPEHGVPNVAEEHVYIRFPAATDGPPDGLNSTNVTVTCPPPEGVDLTRYEIGICAVALPNAVSAGVITTLPGTASLPAGAKLAARDCVLLAVAAVRTWQLTSTLISPTRVKCATPLTSLY
jgi:hypothetical protein